VTWPTARRLMSLDSSHSQASPPSSDYLSSRKLSVVGRSYAVQSPIVPAIALTASTSLDVANEDPGRLLGMPNLGKNLLTNSKNVKNEAKIQKLL
jgi:hypothetical protein